MYRGKISASINWKCHWSRSFLWAMWHLEDHLQRVSLPFSGISFSSSALHHWKPRDPGICDFWGLVITVFTFVERIYFFTQWSSSAFQPSVILGSKVGSKTNGKKIHFPLPEPINAVTLHTWVSKGKYLPKFRSNLKIINRMLIFNILKY